MSRNPLYRTRCDPERQVSQKDQALNLVQHRPALRSNQPRSRACRIVPDLENVVGSSTNGCSIKEPNRNMVNVSFDKISQGEDEGSWYSSGGKVRATFAHFDPRVDKLLKLGENDPKKSSIWKISALPSLPTVSVESFCFSTLRI